MALWQRDYMQPDRDPGLANRWALMPVSLRLIIINCVVWFLWQLLERGPFMPTHFTVSWPGVFEHGRVWTLVTAAFSHFDPWHLLWNMLYLYWFGPDLEQLYGRRNFTLLYLYAAVVSSLAHAVWSHGWGADVPALGASGAVMAVVIVTAIFYPQKTILFMFVLPVPLWILAGLKLVIDLTGLVGSGSGVAHAAHLGGALAGFVFWWLDLRLFPSPGQQEDLEKAGVWSRGFAWLRSRLGSRGRPTAAASAAPEQPPRVDGDTAVQVDELLRKINREGMASLTADELAFLKGASERYRRR